MQVDEVHCRNSASEHEEKVEAALARLKVLKHRISVLRLQCEAFKKRQSEKRGAALVCSECGGRIERGEEVVLKGSSGAVKGRYHKDCFKAIWLS